MPAPWTHDDSNEVKDSVNLKFKTNDLAAIMSVLRGDGWDSPLSWAGRAIATEQYLHVSNTKQKSDNQLCRPPRALMRRFPIRFWISGEAVLASAHVDIFTPFGGHVAESFEKEVAASFARANGWLIEYDGEDLRNFLQKPANNGFATVIRRS